MTYIKNLRVLNLARQNLREIMRLTQKDCKFGDLQNQLQRSALSVVSNIAEGAGYASKKQFARYLRIARASNTEMCQQLQILGDLGIASNEELLENVSYAGKMMSCLIKRL